ncbi:hypothetical protein B0H13DRAFT_1895919 [Mycena leptocephala]|nr:hypothetical protein B0H13DRAFT_1895919 [Mycena leptocephala]
MAPKPADGNSGPKPPRIRTAPKHLIDGSNSEAPSAAHPAIMAQTQARLGAAHHSEINALCKHFPRQLRASPIAANGGLSRVTQIRIRGSVVSFDCSVVPCVPPPSRTPPVYRIAIKVYRRLRSDGLSAPSCLFCQAFLATPSSIRPPTHPFLLDSPKFYRSSLSRDSLAYRTATGIWASHESLRHAPTKGCPTTGKSEYF